MVLCPVTKISAFCLPERISTWKRHCDHSLPSGRPEPAAPYPAMHPQAIGLESPHRRTGCGFASRLTGKDAPLAALSRRRLLSAGPQHRIPPPPLRCGRTNRGQCSSGRNPRLGRQCCPRSSAPTANCSTMLVLERTRTGSNQRPGRIG